MTHSDTLIRSTQWDLLLGKYSWNCTLSIQISLLFLNLNLNTVDKVPWIFLFYVVAI